MKLGEMKKLIIAALCLLALTACTQKKSNPEEQALLQQRDSLTRIIEQKDNEIDDMVATMNDIQEGFRAINEAEQRVTIAKNGEGTTAAEGIRENMEFIQSQMRQNRELISKLRNQLRQSSVKADQLRRTLDNLTQQLDEKDNQLRQLQAELEAKDMQIGELNQQVSALTGNVSHLQEESTQKSQTISTQDKQLNTAWFVFGTKKELKEQHIIEGDRVLQSNFNKSYFTKIDIRVVNEIKLYSKWAKLLTMHPGSSYTLNRDSKDQYVLRITNPQTFWSTSKYLVVQVK